MKFPLPQGCPGARARARSRYVDLDAVDNLGAIDRRCGRLGPEEGRRVRDVNRLQIQSTVGDGNPYA